MLDSARRAVRILQGDAASKLGNDDVRLLAIVKSIEVIGEAASRVSAETRVRLVALPWQQIVGMRNRLIHGYDDIDVQLVFETVERDLPELIALLEAELEEDAR